MLAVDDQQTSASLEPISTKPSLDQSWPLAWLFIGFPLWWLLGFSGFIAMLLVLPMAYQLWRRRQFVVPGGFGWWLLFLTWMALGVFTLWVDAPGAVPGGGVSRLMIFAYRVCWYLACTIVLLWLANSNRKTMTFARVCNLVGWLFLFTVAGGVLGVLAPTLELRSLLDIVLPAGIRSNGFVKSTIHPELADVQMVLGRPEARPKAPFAFANSWGANLAVTLPFFLVGWLRYGRRWQQIAAVPVLLIAALPVVYSLNRGLWVSLLVGVIFFVMLQVSRGRVIALFAFMLMIAIGVLLLIASPLGTMISERLEHAHSNDRRSQLLTQTVSSVANGSPVIGFGGTRDVQGSFASIAGASTPDCKACGVPPLGTQGHLWLVIFSQGLVGALFFLAFFIISFFRSWRCRTTPEVVATCVLLFFALQMFVYDTLGMPLFVIMIAIALAWRAQSRATDSEKYIVRVPTLRVYFDNIWAARRPIAVLIACGALLGVGLAAAAPRAFSAETRVLLAPSPSYLVTGLALDQSPEEITIDTEAALVVSDGTLRRVSSWPYDTNSLRERVTVTAEPNTSVMVLAVRDLSGERAEALVEELAPAYLDVRRQYLLQRRSQVLADLRNRFRELAALGVPTPGVEVDGAVRGSLAEEMESVDLAISNIILTPTSAGEVLRTGQPGPESRNYSMYGASGAALGLLVGLIAMLLLGDKRQVIGPIPNDRSHEKVRL
jgi:hypothetical protein